MRKQNTVRQRPRYTFIYLFFVVILLLLGVSILVAKTSFATMFAAGATYYVHATNGNDANNGSQTSPFKTLSKGVSMLTAGDTLFIEGTFTTPLVINKSGTAALPITIIGINRPKINVGGSAHEAVTLQNQNYIHVSGLEVIGGTSFGIFTYGQHNRIENNIVHDGVLENKFDTGLCGKNGGSGWGSGIKVYVGGNDIAIRGNTSYENCGEGIASTRGINVTIEDNTVRDNYSVNIYVDNSYDVTVKNNYAFCQMPKYFRDGGPASGILLGNENYAGWGSQLHNVLIDGNTIDGCRRISLYNPTNGAVSNFTITNNVFNNVTAPFVSVAGATVSNNIAGTHMPVVSTSTPVPTARAVLPATPSIGPHPTTAPTTRPVPTATPTPELSTVLGDYTGDSQVTIVDFTLYMSYWFLHNIHQADLNRDGRISVIDFTIFMNAWYDSH